MFMLITIINSSQYEDFILNGVGHPTGLATLLAGSMHNR